MPHSLYWRAPRCAGNAVGKRLDKMSAKPRLEKPRRSCVRRPIQRPELPAAYDRGIRRNCRWQGHPRQRSLVVNRSEDEEPRILIWKDCRILLPGYGTRSGFADSRDLHKHPRTLLSRWASSGECDPLIRITRYIRLPRWESDGRGDTATTIGEVRRCRKYSRVLSFHSGFVCNAGPSLFRLPFPDEARP